jgi:uncharacterized protein
MSVSFSVKNVPDAVARALRARAKRNHRSLQGELMAVLEAAVREPAAALAAPAPSEVREAAPAWGTVPVPDSSVANPPPPPLGVETAARPFPIDRHKLGDICRRYHIRRLSLFGSALRPDFRPDSDVDLLAEFDEGHTLGFAVFRLEEELSALVGGRKIDLVNRNYLNARLKPIILASARVLYAEG